MDRLKVGIIFGGCSEEHPISVKSAQEVAKHLDTDEVRTVLHRDHDGAVPGSLRDGRAVVLSPDRSVHGLLVLEQGRYETIRLDLVLPVLHGKLGEDGAMQGLLELSGIPYAGCDIQSSALCMDKSLTYMVARAAGIATPNFWTVTANENIDPDQLTYPVFVKPARSGSSFGVSKAARKEELPGAVQDRATVRLEGADRRGCRRQRGRMCHLGERSGSAGRRGRSDRALARLLQDPSGGRAGKRLRQRDRDRPRGHLRRSHARSSRRRPRPSIAPWDAGGCRGWTCSSRRMGRSSSTRSTRCPA